MRSVLFTAGILMSLNAWAFNDGAYPLDPGAQRSDAAIVASEKSRAEIAREATRPDTMSPYVFHGDVLIDNPNFTSVATQRTDTGMVRKALQSTQGLYVG